VPAASRLSFSCGYTDSGVMFSADFVCSVINEATPPSCDMKLPTGAVKKAKGKYKGRGEGEQKCYIKIINKFKSFIIFFLDILFF